jgi:hypothetical protein
MILYCMKMLKNPERTSRSNHPKEKKIKIDEQRRTPRDPKAGQSSRGKGLRFRLFFPFAKNIRTAITQRWSKQKWMSFTLNYKGEVDRRVLPTFFYFL